VEVEGAGTFEGECVDDATMPGLRACGINPLLLLLVGDEYPYSERNSFMTPPEYIQMPVDLPLAPAEIALIQQWVEAGAPCE
jgi:hypothetical protein